MVQNHQRGAVKFKIISNSTRTAQRTLYEYSNLFSNIPGCTDLAEHDIELKSGTFKPLRLPFGLKNAPYYFSRLMANLLRNCEDFAVPYLDDIVTEFERSTQFN
ncbi:hypothetical protein TNCV_976211 [Trichonephila clavipes]|nr:hypothetical protein TNCV_976211 [Trichonephila clavipes]